MHVHFFGWAKQYDEWIPIGSGRFDVLPPRKSKKGTGKRKAAAQPSSGVSFAVDITAGSATDRDSDTAPMAVTIDAEEATMDTTVSQATSNSSIDEQQTMRQRKRSSELSNLAFDHPGRKSACVEMVEEVCSVSLFLQLHMTTQTPLPIMMCMAVHISLDVRQ